MVNFMLCVFYHNFLNIFKNTVDACYLAGVKYIKVSVFIAIQS